MMLPRCLVGPLYCFRRSKLLFLAITLVSKGSLFLQSSLLSDNICPAEDSLDLAWFHAGHALAFPTKCAPLSNADPYGRPCLQQQASLSAAPEKCH